MKKLKRLKSLRKQRKRNLEKQKAEELNVQYEDTLVEKATENVKLIFLLQ